MAVISVLQHLEGLLAAHLSPDPGHVAALDNARKALADADVPTEDLVEAYTEALRGSLAATGDPDTVLNDLALSSVAFLPPLESAARPFVKKALEAKKALDVSLQVGPATVSLGALPAALPNSAVIALWPISSLGLGFDAGALKASGAGYLRPAEQSAGGILNADLGAVRVVVAALLGEDATSRDLGILALMRASFLPAGIQLGLGFSLDTVGGLFGVNRSADTDAMRASLVDGTALDALFGGSTSSKASILKTLTSLERMFPARAGEVVVGPVMRLGWLNVAGHSLVRLDVGMILVLPRGRVLLPGRAMLEVPGPGVALVQLRADMLGEIDVAGKRISIDAALVDSQVLHVFRIGGTAAAFVSWGEPAVVVMTLGGFYPGFDPRPVQIAPQRRISISLSTPLPGVQLSAEGYVAATTGTLQFGGKATAAYDIGVAAVRCTVGGDALIQLSPLWFTARLFGSAAIEALGEEVASVDCSAVLTGPGPLTLSVSASTKILLQRVGGTKHLVLSSASGADRAPADVLAAVVRRELEAPDNITTDGGADPLVKLTVLEVAEPGDEIRVPLISPVGALVWRQDQFPLDSPIEKADGRLLASKSEVMVVPPTDAAKVSSRLATSSFRDLTDSASLDLPPYVQHETGLSIPVSVMPSPTAAEQTTEFQTIVLPETRWWRSLFFADVTGISSALLASQGSPQLLAGAEVRVPKVKEEAWVVAPDEGQASAVTLASTAAARSHFDPGLVALPELAYHLAAL